MVRSMMTIVAAMAVGALGLLAAPAFACGNDGACACAHKKADKAKVTAHADELAARCKCSSASDCTCKKGQCECPKCSGHKRRLVEPLKGSSGELKIPGDARHDATAGVFI